MNMTKILKTATVLCVALLIALPAAAQVDDWKDIKFP